MKNKLMELLAKVDDKDRIRTNCWLAVSDQSKWINLNLAAISIFFFLENLFIGFWYLSLPRMFLAMIFFGICCTFLILFFKKEAQQIKQLEEYFKNQKGDKN